MNTLTTNNLTTELPKIKSKLPAELQEMSADIISMFEFYGKDADITEAVDLFILEANDNLLPTKPKAEKKQAIAKPIAVF